MTTHQRLDLHGVEPPTRQHQSAGIDSTDIVDSVPKVPKVPRVRGIPTPAETGHDLIDVCFDVDAGLVLELALAILRDRDHPANPLPESRAHHVADVGVRDKRRIHRNVPQLLGSAALQHALRQTDVVRHEAGTDPGH